MANPIFFKLAGYERDELIDQPHSIIRHPDMPQIIFKTLWNALETGNDIHTFVKNLSKDGSFYWVYAFVRVATNPDGSFRNYVSTRKTMSKNAREIIEPLYAKMIEVEKIELEKIDGIKKSSIILEDFLISQGASLDTLNDAIINLQNA